MQRRILALALMTSLGLAACGGGSDDDPADTPPAAGSGSGSGDGSGSTPPPDQGGAGGDGGGSPEPDPGSGEPGPGPGAGAAADCYNPAQYAAGATFTLDYNVSGLFTGTQSSAGSTANASFNGHAALEVTQNTTTRYTGLPQADTSVLFYMAHFEDRVIEQYGNRSEASVMGMNAVTVVTIDPPFRSLMWTLAPGATQDYSYDMATETTITGGPVPLPPQVGSSNVSGSVTYEGQQSVSVPAGSFNACVFLTRDDGTETRVWHAAGTGAIVKSVTQSAEGELTLELTAGTLNGSSVVP